MKVSQDFIKLAERYAKITGIGEADDETLEQLAMWLATCDEITLNALLENVDKTSDDERDVEFVSLDNVDENVLVDTVSSESKTYNISSGPVKVDLKTKDIELQITPDVNKQKENGKPKKIKLEKKPLKSKALKRINDNAEKNKKTLSESHDNDVVNNYKIRLHPSSAGSAKGVVEVLEYNPSDYVKNIVKAANLGAKAKRKIVKMSDNDYYNFSNNVKEDNWDWIDDDVMEKEWKEYENEIKARRQRISRFLKEVYKIKDNGERLSSKEIDSLYKTKGDFGRERRKQQKLIDRYRRIEVIDPNIKNRVDISLKKELEEIRAKLQKDLNKKKKELLTKANAEAIKIKNRIKNNVSKSISKAVKKDIIKKPSLSKSRKNIVATSSLEVRGISNIFNTKYSTYSVNKILTKSGKELLIPSYDMVRRTKKTTIPIPKRLLRSAVEDAYYGSVIAAAFFQMLVSNTPLDENYSYEYEYSYIARKKPPLYETVEYYNLDSKKKNKQKVKTTRIYEDIRGEYLGSAEIKKRKRTIHHEADKEAVRDSWYIRFKGVTFCSGDSIFKGLFEKKSDQASIDKIAQIFYEKTKKSTIKSNSFIYENTNPRWEMLEYGYYLKDSKARTGTPYGYSHGVKNNFSIQAPHGFIRLVEARWTQMVENNTNRDFLANFIRRNKLDVSHIRKKTLEKLKEIDPSIGAKGLDFSNLETGVYK